MRTQRLAGALAIAVLSRCSPRSAAIVAALIVVLTASPGARAAFQSFGGGPSAEASWRADAGSYVIETFDNYAPNTPISSLPALGLTFDALAAGGQPGIYLHHVDNTPSAPLQIANVPGNCCISPAYQNGDVVARVITGIDLHAFGFWNGDPQGTALLRVYDRLDNFLGSVSAAANSGGGDTFAGFISSTPVGRLEFEGASGDGWNHYDDFQASVTASIPEPEAYALLLAGLGLLGFAWRRKVR